MVRFHLNGNEVGVDVSGDMPLLWALRDVLGLTGTKYGCGMALCGACTVHVDGKAVRSCVLPVSGVAGHSVTTIEGMGTAGKLHAVQQAWVDEQVPQCGYCQPGMIMTVAAAIRAGHHGAEILSELKNLCVCGTYGRIRDAVLGL